MQVRGSMTVSGETKLKRHERTAGPAEINRMPCAATPLRMSSPKSWTKCSTKQESREGCQSLQNPWWRVERPSCWACSCALKGSEKDMEAVGAVKMKTAKADWGIQSQKAMGHGKDIILSTFNKTMSKF